DWLRRTSAAFSSTLRRRASSSTAMTSRARGSAPGEAPGLPLIRGSQVSRIPPSIKAGNVGVLMGGRALVCAGTVRPAPGLTGGNPAEMTLLYDWLKKAAKVQGNTRKALRYRDNYLSWRGLLERVDRRAQEFGNMGIKEGDWVGLMLGNVPDFVILA